MFALLRLLLIGMAFTITSCALFEHDSSAESFYATGAVATDDGGFFLVGKGIRDSSPTEERAFLGRFSADGTPRWIRYSTGLDPVHLSPRGEIAGLRNFPKGNLFASGPQAPFSQEDSTGRYGWEYTVGNSCVSYYGSSALAADGGYIITGESHDWVQYALSILKLDFQGYQVFCRSFVGSYAVHAIAPCRDGGFALWTKHASGTLLLRCDPTADTLWTAVVDTSEYSGYGIAMREDSDGGFLAATGDPAVLKLNDHGEKIWRHEIYGPYATYPSDMARAPDGSVLIAVTFEKYIGPESPPPAAEGIEAFTGTNANSLVKLSADGQELWKKYCPYTLSQARLCVLSDGSILLLCARSVDDDRGHYKAAYLAKFNSSGDLLWEHTSDDWLRLHS